MKTKSFRVRQVQETSEEEFEVLAYDTRWAAKRGAEEIFDHLHCQEDVEYLDVLVIDETGVETTWEVSVEEQIERYFLPRPAKVKK